jgi:hypothetical protein
MYHFSLLKNNKKVMDFALNFIQEAGKIGSHETNFKILW